jgi:short-subunit dehydrogenase
MFDLTGQYAVLTGGSRGLGSYMAKALARAGADLIITARKAADCARTETAIREIGRDVRSYSLDVREEQSILDFAAAVQTDGLTPSILVNNAGCNVRKPFLEITWDE